LKFNYGNNYNHDNTVNHSLQPLFSVKSTLPFCPKHFSTKNYITFAAWF